MGNEIEVKNVDIVVSKGDKEGKIIYANPIFVKLSGYTQGDLLDEPHSILRHPDMPKLIFKYLWDNLQAGNDTTVFVKNLTKNGDYYWVSAHVRPATNPDGSFRNYVSTRKIMTGNAKNIIEPLYAKMVEAENAGGMAESLKVLEEFLSQNNATLATFSQHMKSINK